MIVAAIPSPTTSVWHLLGLPIRAYALCIVLGIVAAVLIMEHRMRSRGVAPWASLDIAVWAVPFGIIGARIYHLITSPQDYFGSGGHPIDALYIWKGGLGIWGAVAAGALGAYIGCRQLRVPFSLVADSLAVGLPVAQAIGRLGNWFNNELYGKATTLPWGLRVHDMDSNNPGHALTIDGQPVTKAGLYQPTFLYELVWDLGVAGLVWALDRKYKFGRGRAFALYVMAYTAGRFWIELLRIDDANHIFGIRINVFTAGIVFVAALVYFVIVRGPRAYVVPDDAPTTAPEPVDAAAEGEVRTADGRLAGVEDGPRRTPKGYLLVSEARFEAYRKTGVLPPDTPEDRALEIAAGGHPVEPDPAGPAGNAEAVLATGAAATTGPDGATGGDAEAAPAADPVEDAEEAAGGDAEAVLATGSSPATAPDGATGGDAEVDKRPSDEN